MGELRSSRTVLTPQAFCYLRNPILSSGETMLHYTVQHLCITGAIHMAWRRVVAHPRDNRTTPRLLLSRASRPAVYRRDATYVLGLLPKDREVSVGQLRTALLKDMPDLETFKYEHVLPDLVDQGLLRYRFVRTSEGIEAMDQVRDQCTWIERALEEGSTPDRETLSAALNALGSNVVLLNRHTRDRLGELIKAFPELRTVEPSLGVADPMTAFHAFTMLGTDLFGASSAVGTLDFGGFADGDFGSTVLGGDW